MDIQVSETGKVSDTASLSGVTIPNQRVWPVYTAALKLLRNRLFVWVVVFPTIVATLYFGLIASDVYVSESRFVIRSPQSQSASPLGLILKGAGFARAQDDSYTVQDFILSRDALRAIDAKLHLARAFGNANVDIFNRFAGLGGDGSFEALHRYWQKKVHIQLDSASSIATLTTRAFTAEDAYRINVDLLELSEDEVNRLNERGRQDMIHFAATEVAEAAAKAKEAALAVATYRNDKGVIDPEKQSSIPLQQVAKLQDDLVSDKTQIAQLEQIAKQSPQLPVLRRRVKLLEVELRAESTRVAGGGAGSLAGKAAGYEKLALDREFADKLLASAMSSLEEARSDAQRQQLYLERIVQPNKPDIAVEPKRVRDVLIVAIVSIITWGILTLLIAGVREHYE